MKILVTGGCGYNGSVLVPKLLEKGHTVISVDTQWFGNYLSSHPNLKNLKSDVRDISASILKGIDVVIHLANIANDPAVELNPNLSWEVNVLATQQLIEKSRKEGVKQFIFASSGSVYGIKDELRVTEDLPLIPISVYNKTKMVAERVFLSFKEKMDMDKLLNRGKYSIQGELNIVDEEVKIGWKMFGMGKEFTKTDKLIYIVNYAWTIFWTIVFIIGTTYNLYNPVSDDTWMSYWKFYIYVHLILSFFVIIWFTIGGFIDLRKMIFSLDSVERDHGDTGWVAVSYTHLTLPTIYSV